MDLQVSGVDKFVDELRLECVAGMGTAILSFRLRLHSGLRQSGACGAVYSDL